MSFWGSSFLSMMSDSVEYALDMTSYYCYKYLNRTVFVTAYGTISALFITVILDLENKNC